MRRRLTQISLFLLTLIGSTAAICESATQSDSSLSAPKARLSKAQVLRSVTAEAKRRKIRLDVYSAPIIKFDPRPDGLWEAFYNGKSGALDDCFFFQVNDKTGAVTLLFCG
jgi:hypothetical protein